MAPALEPRRVAAVGTAGAYDDVVADDPREFDAVSGRPFGSWKI
jgi:hypothetical protein